MGPPALKDDLGNKVKAASTIRIGIVVRIREILIDKPKGARIKPKKPGAKIPRPLRARNALLADKI
jgi:hypothetical protein